jgi:hypothetical protein
MGTGQSQFSPIAMEVVTLFGVESVASQGISVRAAWNEDWRIDNVRSVH